MLSISLFNTLPAVAAYGFPCSNALFQEGDRAQLQAAGVAAVFEPVTLYHTPPSDAVGGGGCTGAGEGSNVVGREVAHPDAHETFVQVWVCVVAVALSQLCGL